MAQKEKKKKRNGPKVNLVDKKLSKISTPLTKTNFKEAFSHCGQKK